VIDDEMLAEVDMAEAELRRLGLGHVRVRPVGDAAWLDVPLDDIPVIARDPLRSEVLRAVCGAGFRRVAVRLGEA
jgi:uncharacterized protein